jgi:serine phosphatase RsbU (regulator of sigma subunit)
VAPGVVRHQFTLSLPPGTVLCLLTDGLIERRDEPIDHRLRRLCKTVTTEHPDVTCAAVTVALIGNDPAPDDVALLIARRLPLGSAQG